MKKKMIMGLIVAIGFLPVVVFAEQDEWMTFQQHQREEQIAFAKQLKEEKENFLKQHPDIVARLEQEKKAAQERSQKMMEQARLRMQERKAQGPKAQPSGPSK